LLSKLLKINNYILFVICFILIYACSNNTLFYENKILPNKQWDRNNLLKFDVNIKDTTTAYNIFITIRINGNYSRRNLYVFSRIISPEKKELVDTLNFLLADEKGRWYGKSNLGDLYYNKFFYKKNVIFPKKGLYTFIFEQAMRSKIVENIEDFGLIIEKKH